MAHMFEQDGEWVKRCPHCKETKIVGAFANNRTKPDGRDDWCRQCRKLTPKNTKRARQEPDGRWVKECARCHEVKEVSLFSPYARSHDGFTSFCKDCNTKATQKSRARDITKARHRDAEYALRRRQNDMGQRILHGLRSRVNRLVERGKKAASTQGLIGCSLDEFRVHLERQFAPGMSWSNYGRQDGQWSIDHVTPCQVFDLTQESHQRACFSYLNSRPTWHADNMAKNDALEDGTRARDLTPDQKRAYLMSHGYAYLFEPPIVPS